MKGWKFESHRHMLAAKGVKSNSYMAFRSGAVVPMENPSDLEINKRKDEFKGFISRQRTPLEEFLFEREKSATVGSQRVLKLRQVMRDPVQAEMLQSEFRRMQQLQYDADQLRAVGDKRGAVLHELQAQSAAKSILNATTPDVKIKEAFQNTITQAEDSRIKREYVENAPYPVQQDIEVVKGMKTAQEARAAKETRAKEKEMSEFNTDIENVVLSNKRSDEDKKEGI
jgi:hypothetical protein